MRWRLLAKLKSKNSSQRKEEIVNCLLKNRGLVRKIQQKEFLNPKEPRLLQPKDVGISPVQINKAIKRIVRAIKSKEKIIVWGDYDTDGVCATAIVWETLHQLKAQVMPFIPKREEGYGLKVKKIDEFLAQGVKLIVTVDHGIVHPKQVTHAQRIGIDMIVTDHHLPGKKKPPAFAVIHTTKLAGCGVAWFFCRQILKKLKKPTGSSLDLVTIGTITDMVKLIGPNRSIVKFGLKELSKTKRPGLVNLFNLAGMKRENISTYEISFIIGPRLNAAGRMDDPMESLRLVCTPVENRASVLARQINERNQERQTLTEQTALHARELWFSQDGKSSLIFVHHHSYQEGVIGLVASKLKEEFYRPAIVIAEKGKWAKGSARSIDGFNIIEAIRASADILGSHGGHPGAAGFSIETEKISLLKQRLIDFAQTHLDKKTLKPILIVDVEVNLSDIDLDLYKMIGQLEPFGIGNPRPVFSTPKVRVTDAKTVGSTQRHLKLLLADYSGETRGLIGFNMGDYYSKLEPDKLIDVAFSLLVDEWDGEKKIQLKAEDIKIEKPHRRV
jgi:single-stranded-DNA-specific exonuclease